MIRKVTTEFQDSSGYLGTSPTITKAFQCASYSYVKQCFPVLVFRPVPNAKERRGGVESERVTGWGKEVLNVLKGAFNNWGQL